MSKTYLDVFRQEFGRQRRISRAQLQGFLCDLAALHNLDIRNYAHWYGCPPNTSLGEICRRIANALEETTFLSLGGPVRDIDYNWMGTTQPIPFAQLIFAASDLDRIYGADGFACLRRHARRLVLVTGTPLPSLCEVDHPEVRNDNN